MTSQSTWHTAEIELAGAVGSKEMGQEATVPRAPRVGKGRHKTNEIREEARKPESHVPGNEAEMKRGTAGRDRAVRTDLQLFLGQPARIHPVLALPRCALM